MNAATKRSIASALLDIGAVGFTPETPITFKSGIRSPVYVDNRRLTFHPQAWRVVIEGFVSTIDARALEFAALAGVALGGVAHCAAIAWQVGKPAVFVRKETKAHGTGKRIEGGDIDGLRVLLVEDLVTTGGSSLSGVAALREARRNGRGCLRHRQLRIRRCGRSLCRCWLAPAYTDGFFGHSSCGARIGSAGCGTRGYRAQLAG